MAEKTVECSKCHEVKPKSEFYTRYGSLIQPCKECEQRRRKAKKRVK